MIKIALIAVALGHVVLFLFIALARLGYPYELEWMEGGVLVHMVRVLEGRPLYLAPSLEFVPFIYPPLYYYAAALAALAAGPGFLALRLVSLAASLACLGLIFAIVRRESRSPAAGLLAAGLYAATYPLSGFWFDLARVDPLFLALILGGVYFLICNHQSAIGNLAAGLLFAAAFFAKQTALMIAAPLVLYTLVFEPWRRKWIFPLALAGPVILGMEFLDRATQGWFSYYIFKLPGHHALVDYHVWRFWVLDLARPLPVACALAVIHFCRKWPQNRDQATLGKSGLLLCFTVGAVGAAYFSRLHLAGFANVVMPAYAAMAILFGLAVAPFTLQKPEPQLQDAQSMSLPAEGTYRRDALAMLLCLVQFAILFYNPIPQIPTRADRAAGDEFVARLRAVPGEVLVPYHDYLIWRAGKAPHAHLMAVIDVVRGDATEGARLENEIRAGLQSHRWTAIFLDSEWYADDLEQAYESMDYVFRGQDFLTRTGSMHIRPGILYSPIK